MTIDEVIEKSRKFCCMNCDKFSCKECKETRNQISDLLEELKAYKETKCNKSVYLSNKSIDMIDAVNKGYADGYNNAIDDAIKIVKENYRMEALERLEKIKAGD